MHVNMDLSNEGQYGHFSVPIMTSQYFSANLSISQQISVLLSKSQYFSPNLSISQQISLYLLE